MNVDGSATTYALQASPDAGRWCQSPTRMLTPKNTLRVQGNSRLEFEEDPDEGSQAIQALQEKASRL